MKKTVLMILAFASVTVCVKAQSVEDGVKFLYYQKNKSAKDALQAVVSKDPKNAQAIYWLGQAYLADQNVAEAKALYQKALNDGINDPWIWVGMGHVELLENNDINAAKQKFEQAITATTPTKGRDKNKPDPAILDAIGRANADGSSKTGDPNYAIEKLKQAQQLDTKNPDIDIQLGINYLKLGSQHGGEAVEAFRDATVRNPQYAAGYSRIGRVYQSQNNTEAMNEWYGKAIAADPNYGPVYYNYFDYYKDRDVNVAKEYLDKYVANSDQDCATQYFQADYLFRAGKYQESIAKADSMANSDCKTYPRLNILYAYNYNRLGDSLKAKDYMQQFLQTVPDSKRQPDDYLIAGTIFSHVSGLEDSAVAYLSRAMEIDTVAKNKQRYVDSIAAVYKRAHRPQERLHWVRQSYQLSPTPTNRDIFDLADAALKADSLQLADSMFAFYEEKYPDQVYGYYGRVQTAQKMDTTGEAAVKPMNDYINFMMSDTAKNGASIAYYHALLGGYYANYAKNLDSAILEFQQSVRFAPDNDQYKNYLDILTNARDKANKPQKSPATKPKTGTKK